MKPLDSLKAALVAVMVLALNLALTTALIFAYASVIDPGRPPAFYTAKAPQIAEAAAPPLGALLLFAAAYGLGRRRPQRKAVVFAAALGAAYAVLDAVSGAASAGTGAIANPIFAISMALATAGALGGGVLAARRNR
ncbi:hypothetical protein [Phenylobacterium sp.]|uniref:hypothetical protein n=1 Tax=Phenylobacterium sp. TaxID=1871053 RepID=UPI0012131266|nr:hypothetical protein [Phenylobacterium sp.]THD54369.1 MAG: hypothetical protein E8A12_17210 [Phenylobacterium sp.]